MPNIKPNPFAVTLKFEEKSFTKKETGEVVNFTQAYLELPCYPHRINIVGSGEANKVRLKDYIATHREEA